MTDDNSQQTGQAPRPSWMDTPPSWYHTPPAHHSPPQNTPQSTGNSDLLQAIQAMPEKVVRAIREATGQNQPQQTAPPPQQTPPPPQPSQSTQDTPPKVATFGEWWFGKTG